MRYTPGLRAKLNVVILPVLATTIALMIAADYRREVGVVMAAHAIHDGRTDRAQPAAAGPVTRVTPETNPDTAARTMLLEHSAFGVLAVLVVLGGVNVALSRFVLRPLQQLRAVCLHMERGHWRQSMPRSGDEMGTATGAFEDLGLALDALVGQALQAERLATVTLLARTLTAHIEPEVAAIAASVARLHASDLPLTREEAHRIAVASANIIASLRGVDHAFDLSFRQTKGGERYARAG